MLPEQVAHPLEIPEPNGVCLCCFQIIYRTVLDVDVQVRKIGIARIADLRQDIACPDGIARLHPDAVLFQMRQCHIKGVLEPDDEVIARQLVPFSDEQVWQTICNMYDLSVYGGYDFSAERIAILVVGAFIFKQPAILPEFDNIHGIFLAFDPVMVIGQAAGACPRCDPGAFEG